MTTTAASCTCPDAKVTPPSWIAWKRASTATTAPPRTCAAPASPASGPRAKHFGCWGSGRTTRCRGRLNGSHNPSPSHAVQPGSGPICSMNAASAAICRGRLLRCRRSTALIIGVASYPPIGSLRGLRRVSRRKRSSTRARRPLASVTSWPAKLARLGPTAVSCSHQVTGGAAVGDDQVCSLCNQLLVRRERFSGGLGFGRGERGVGVLGLARAAA